MATVTEVDIGSLISRRPGVVGGRPCIAGTRMPVKRIAVLHNAGETPEEILAGWPHLTLSQVHAALAYYFANKAQIDADIEEDLRVYDELARQHPRDPNL